MTKHRAARADDGDDDGDTLMTAEEVGAKLEVAGRTVLRMAARGDYPPALVISWNVRRFSLRAHNAWVAERTRRNVETQAQRKRAREHAS